MAAIPMGELRAFIDLLPERYGVPCPLAHHRPFIADRRLLLEAQDLVGLEAEFCLVAVASGQLILTPPSQSSVERVTWEADVAAAWRPHDDPRSPVLMAPDARFGRPAVRGVSTEVLWEHVMRGRMWMTWRRRAPPVPTTVSDHSVATPDPIWIPRRPLVASG